VNLWANGVASRRPSVFLNRETAISKNARKPIKLRPDFLLSSHRNGRWAKRMPQETHFFGVWGDPEAALQEYLRIRDDLQAGRIPTPDAGSSAWPTS
jgi:hypothetical protein